MDDAMVTGRMSAEKKKRAGEILARAGLNHSQAINRLYDTIIEKQSASFLLPEKREHTKDEWAEALAFIDDLASGLEIDERFLYMSKSEIKEERLRSRGLL